jgi:hypothetical protein
MSELQAMPISIRLMTDTLTLLDTVGSKKNYSRAQAIEHLIHAGLIATGVVTRDHKFQQRPGMGPKPGHKFTERTLIAQKKRLAKSKS